jgi:hypothetical protein
MRLDIGEAFLSLGLHPRATRDFLDGLVGLGFLQRTGGIYGNSEETKRFLDRASKEYVGGLLAMASRRLFPAWAGLTRTLQTGQPSTSTTLRLSRSTMMVPKLWPLGHGQSSIPTTRSAPVSRCGEDRLRCRRTVSSLTAIPTQASNRSADRLPVL